MIPLERTGFMYERFTDRSRKVMQLANQEAQRFNHKYVGTEHVLLALIKEGSGVAANVLKNLDIDLGKVRSKVEEIVKSGPDMVTMGKLPQTPRAKKCIEQAIAWAGKLEHNYVGTEHLLLGLLSESESTACKVLVSCGVTLKDVQEETLCLLGTEGKQNREAKRHPGRLLCLEALLEAALEELKSLRIGNVQFQWEAHVVTLERKEPKE